MSVRPLSPVLPTIDLAVGMLAVTAPALGLLGGGAIIPAAQAQSAQQNLSRKSPHGRVDAVKGRRPNNNDCCARILIKRGEQIRC